MARLCDHLEAGAGDPTDELLGARDRREDVVAAGEQWKLTKPISEGGAGSPAPSSTAFL